MGLTRRPRPSGDIMKKKPKYWKGGHLVCPFEGYELLHEKPKPRRITLNEAIRRLNRI
jgi:hypothetical protein